MSLDDFSRGLKRELKPAASGIGFFSGLTLSMGFVQLSSISLTGLTIGAFGLVLIPALFLAKKLCDDIDSPGALIGTQLLLGASTLILSKCMAIAFIGFFVSATVNPFTLPLMIAAGASALVMLGLYMLTEIDYPEENEACAQMLPG